MCPKLRVRGTGSEIAGGGVIYLSIFPAERRRAGLAIPIYLFLKSTPPPMEGGANKYLQP